MGIPWQSILAGLGQGAAGLGEDINRRRERDEMLRRDDEIRRMATERQQAQDALNLITSVGPMGGSVLPEDADPIQALAKRTEANTLASGGAIPNSALGIPEESVPDAFGSPSVQRVGQANVLFDPSKSRDAMQERRGIMQQERLDRRAQGAQQATAARDEATRTAGALTRTKEARGYYETLKSLNPKHPLVVGPFDADNTPNYKDALDFEQAKSLQSSQYHPPPKTGTGSRVPASAMKDFTQMDAIEVQAEAVERSLQDAVDNKIDATGRAFGVIPEPGWIMKLRKKGEMPVKEGEAPPEAKPGQRAQQIRNNIQNLFATIAKERGGTALSLPELDLLQSYLPNKDDSEEVNLQAAKDFLATLRRIRERKLQSYQKYGYGVDDEASTADRMLQTPGGNGPGGRTITVNGKTFKVP